MFSRHLETVLRTDPLIDEKHGGINDSLIRYVILFVGSFFKIGYFVTPTISSLGYRSVWFDCSRDANCNASCCNVTGVGNDHEKIMTYCLTATHVEARKKDLHRHLQVKVVFPVITAVKESNKCVIS